MIYLYNDDDAEDTCDYIILNSQGKSTEVLKNEHPLNICMHETTEI